MVRARVLPSGWYPDSAERVAALCREWEHGAPARSAWRAAIVPHAGWIYSGRIAYLTLRSLAADGASVVVVGGHLRPGDTIRVAPEDAYETPIGTLRSDSRLRSYLRRHLDCIDDVQADNTVEVQLPLIHHLFDDVRCLSLRAAPDDRAIELGRAVYEYAQETGTRVCLVGSTDLTHYGPAYGFTPHGQGEGAVRWVREVNDRRIVDAMLDLDARAVIDLSLRDRSACSAGGAVAAIEFARAMGADASYVAYAQSCDVGGEERRVADSFVGYVGIGFSVNRSSNARV